MSAKWLKIKAEAVLSSHETFLPTSHHWCCQISPQASPWFTDGLISSEQLDREIEWAFEMQGTVTKGTKHSQQPSKTPRAWYFQPASSFTCSGEGMSQKQWIQQLLFPCHDKKVSLDQNSWAGNHMKKLFKGLIWHAKCPRCVSNGLLLAVANGSPLCFWAQRENYERSSVTFYNWSFLAVFRTITWTWNHFWRCKMSTSQ